MNIPMNFGSLPRDHPVCIFSKLKSWKMQAQKIQDAVDKRPHVDEFLIGADNTGNFNNVRTFCRLYLLLKNNNVIFWLRFQVNISLLFSANWNIIFWQKKKQLNIWIFGEFIYKKIDTIPNNIFHNITLMKPVCFILKLKTTI